MEIVFFVARPDEAMQVASSADLPGDPAAEPIRVDGPGALGALSTALGVGPESVPRPLRDATCRSFPVWLVSESLCGVLASLDDAAIDRGAEAWRVDEDADLYERASCLAELRGALREREEGEALFALFEERAV